eukprot:m.27758 g.27758  ORF g.27758 m.27758 type:complete len:213 (+) comp7933_c0_seq1:203-841(+)
MSTSKRKAKKVNVDVPRSAREIMAILKAMGITDFEPRVVPQLIEFAHRYISDILEDASRYAEHRGKTGDEAKITKEDLRLAAQATVDFTCSGPPPREFLMEMASQKNQTPLPIVEDEKFGVRLPPDRFCLLNPNYNVLPSKKRPREKCGPWDLPPTEAAIRAARLARENRMKRKLKDAEVQEATKTQTVADADGALGNTEGWDKDDKEDDYD